MTSSPEPRNSFRNSNFFEKNDQYLTRISEEKTISNNSGDDSFSGNIQSQVPSPSTYVDYENTNLMHQAQVYPHHVGDLHNYPQTLNSLKKSKNPVQNVQLLQNRNQSIKNRGHPHDLHKLKINIHDQIPCDSPISNQNFIQKSSQRIGDGPNYISSHTKQHTNQCDSYDYEIKSFDTDEDCMQNAINIIDEISNQVGENQTLINNIDRDNPVSITLNQCRLIDPPNTSQEPRYTPVSQPHYYFQIPHSTSSLRSTPNINNQCQTITSTDRNVIQPNCSNNNLLASSESHESVCALDYNQSSEKVKSLRNTKKIVNHIIDREIEKILSPSKELDSNKPSFEDYRRMTIQSVQNIEMELLKLKQLDDVSERENNNTI